MANTFHLAVPAGDLAETKRFYCEILGCAEGNQEPGRWVDINFWGNELTLHQSEEQLPGVRHDVDMLTKSWLVTIGPKPEQRCIHDSG